MWRRAWIISKTGKKGTTYHVRFYDDEFRLRSESAGGSIKRAEERRRQKEQDLNTGIAGQPRARRQPLSQFAAERLAALQGEITPASLRTHREALARLQAVIGDIRIDAICTRHVEKFRRHRATAWTLRWYENGRRCSAFAGFTLECAEDARLAKIADLAVAGAKHPRAFIDTPARPATVNKDLRTLRWLWSIAIERGRLAGPNPFEIVGLLREARIEPRALSEREVFALLAHAPDQRWKTFILLGVTTGMRSGEMTALRWEDIDLDAGTAVVRNDAQRQTKANRQRIAVLPPATVDAMRTLGGRAPRGLVFAETTGTPMINNLQRRLGAICNAAGIDRISPHILRKTFCTAMERAGAPTKTTQEAAGHASMQTTARYYTAVDTSAIRAAVARLPWSGIMPKSCLEPSPEHGTQTA